MSEVSHREREQRARAAREKRAAFGPDLDLGKYEHAVEEQGYLADLSAVPADERQTLLDTGIVLDGTRQRSATFILKDQSPIHFSTKQEDVEVLSLSQALKTHDWLDQYLWRAIEVDADKYTAHVALEHTDGYFIRSLPGARTTLPVQACLYLGHKKLAQRVHNVIIAEENSELHIITGCSSHPMSTGLHLGVSEFYVKKGARLSFTMIHNWAPGVEVRPRSAAIIEENGVFMSNYLALKPVHAIQMYPSARCVGPNARARFNSVLVALQGSRIDSGSRILLDSPGSKGEIISRTISNGGEIIARGDIQGNAVDVKGHLECRGLILGESGMIRAIPELTGRLARVDLSHEAAVGKIAEEEVEYLMSRGLTRDQATAMIVRGFLKVDIEGLPPELDKEIQKAMEESEGELF
ncbi:MAG: SufD family Fe-S cluster assembly protein [Deltaproteobacteria bacterium]|nr:SufD family Fe-S cluster assembly protein [Deltaproteobacteria bacterium]